MHENTSFFTAFDINRGTEIKNPHCDCRVIVIYLFHHNFGAALVRALYATGIEPDRSLCYAVLRFVFVMKRYEKACRVTHAGLKKFNLIPLEN
jgi:hypothetical protein